MSEKNSVEELQIIRLRIVRGTVGACIIMLILLLLLVVPLKIALPTILGVAGFLWIVVWSTSRTTTYVCTKCSTRFKISAWIDFVAPINPIASSLPVRNAELLTGIPADERTCVGAVLRPEGGSLTVRLGDPTAIMRSTAAPDPRGIGFAGRLQA